MSKFSILQITTSAETGNMETTSARVLEGADVAKIQASLLIESIGSHENWNFSDRLSEIAEQFRLHATRLQKEVIFSIPVKDMSQRNIVILNSTDDFKNDGIMVHLGWNYHNDTIPAMYFAARNEYWFSFKEIDTEQTNKELEDLQAMSKEQLIDLIFDLRHNISNI